MILLNVTEWINSQPDLKDLESYKWKATKAVKDASVQNASEDALIQHWHFIEMQANNMFAT